MCHKATYFIFFIALPFFFWFWRITFTFIYSLVWTHLRFIVQGCSWNGSVRTESRRSLFNNRTPKVDLYRCYYVYVLLWSQLRAPGLWKCRCCCHFLRQLKSNRPCELSSRPWYQKAEWMVIECNRCYVATAVRKRKREEIIIKTALGADTIVLVISLFP